MPRREQRRVRVEQEPFGSIGPRRCLRVRPRREISPSRMVPVEKIVKRTCGHCDKPYLVAATRQNDTRAGQERGAGRMSSNCLGPKPGRVSEDATTQKCCSSSMFSPAPQQEGYGSGVETRLRIFVHVPSRKCRLSSHLSDVAFRRRLSITRRAEHCSERMRRGVKKAGSSRPAECVPHLRLCVLNALLRGRLVVLRQLSAASSSLLSVMLNAHLRHRMKNQK